MKSVVHYTIHTHQELLDLLRKVRTRREMIAAGTWNDKHATALEASSGLLDEKGKPFLPDLSIDPNGDQSRPVKLVGEHAGQFTLVPPTKKATANYWSLRSFLAFVTLSIAGIDVRMASVPVPDLPPEEDDGVEYDDDEEEEEDEAL